MESKILHNLPRVLRAYQFHEEKGTRAIAEEIGIERDALYRLADGKAVNQATLLTILKWLLD